MTQDTEKALLEFIEAVAQNFVTGTEDSYRHKKAKARAYLASLEPKPEPKRGVEEILLDVLERKTFYLAQIERLLQLYREERERVEEIAARLRAGVGAAALERSDMADELERRNAD